MTSNAVTLTAESGPKITTQPTNKTATAGEKVTFKVVATGDDLTYQWQYKKPGGSWKDCSGTSATFTTTAYASYNGYQYRCEISDGTTIVTSNAVTLTVG